MHEVLTPPPQVTVNRRDEKTQGNKHMYKFWNAKNEILTFGSNLISKLDNCYCGLNTNAFVLCIAKYIPKVTAVAYEKGSYCKYVQ